ncbi:MAG: NAD-dependent epimerase/dehydratase family protein [Thermoplasmata archaeon]
MTGALGAIGVNLIPSLKKEGHNVIGTDVRMTEFSDYVRSDITSFEEMYRIFEESRPDIVIHMAGEVGRLMGERYPQKMIYVNDYGTLNMIKLCLEYKTTLVNFSTSEVYGHLYDKGEEVREEDLELHQTAFGTTNVYALSKLLAEALVKHYVDNYGLKAVTIRPCMVYGPGETPAKNRSAIANFIHEAMTGKKITVHKGTVRAWCYITDFVDGVRLVMDHASSKRYEAYNIGSDEYYTAERFAEIVLEVCGGKKSQIKLVDPPRQFLSPVKRTSIEKAREIGYAPKVTLRKGIKLVAAWQREQGFAKKDWEVE